VPERDAGRHRRTTSDATYPISKHRSKRIPTPRRSNTKEIRYRIANFNKFLDAVSEAKLIEREDSPTGEPIAPGCAEQRVVFSLRLKHGETRRRRPVVVSMRG
jgi:hypothetical protein